MSPRWMHLPRLALKEISYKEEKGVKIQLFVSPHDIPRAVRGYEDEQTGRFIIEFKYLDEEPLTTAQEGPAVFIRLGRHSQRIFAIELDTARFHETNVIQLELLSQVKSAIRKLDDVADDASLKTNHRLAVDVIEERKERLLPALA